MIFRKSAFSKVLDFSVFNLSIFQFVQFQYSWPTKSNMLKLFNIFSFRAFKESLENLQILENLHSSFHFSAIQEIGKAILQY